MQIKIMVYLNEADRHHRKNVQQTLVVSTPAQLKQALDLYVRCDKPRFLSFTTETGTDLQTDTIAMAELLHSIEEAILAYLDTSGDSDTLEISQAIGVPQDETNDILYEMLHFDRISRIRPFWTLRNTRA